MADDTGAVTEWAELIESVQGRVRKLGDRLDGEELALFRGLVGELADLTALAEARL